MLYIMNSNLVTRSCKNPIRRRYRVTFMSSMGVYCLAVFAISGWFGWEPPKSGFGLYLAAISPALPIAYAVFVMGRYLRDEPDEFFRSLQIQSTLIGAGLTMVTCTAWGFLAQYAGVWSMPLYLVFPMWAFWMGLAMPFVNRRYR
jgi:hypothetical protein